MSASGGQSYTIGGTVSGLSGSGLVLQNNGTDDLALLTDGTFTFETSVYDDRYYDISVKTQPTGPSQACRAINNKGYILGENVTNVSVLCSTWIGQDGVAGTDSWSTGIATDMNGNVYVTGYTSGALDGNTLTGVYDFFLVKYDSTGNKLFAKQMGVAGADSRATGVAVDMSGNVYVTGNTDGGLDGNTLRGTTDFFLTMYNSSGDNLYTKQVGTARANTFASNVTVDSSGNVYVTGFTDAGLDGNTVTGTYDFFLTKFDSPGNK